MNWPGEFLTGRRLSGGIRVLTSLVRVDSVSDLGDSVSPSMPLTGDTLDRDSLFEVGDDRIKF